MNLKKNLTSSGTLETHVLFYKIICSHSKSRETIPFNEKGFLSLTLLCVIFKWGKLKFWNQVKFTDSIIHHDIIQEK